MKRSVQVDANIKSNEADLSDGSGVSADVSAIVPNRGVHSQEFKTVLNLLNLKILNKASNLSMLAQAGGGFDIWGGGSGYGGAGKYGGLDLPGLEGVNPVGAEGAGGTPHYFKTQGDLATYLQGDNGSSLIGENVKVGGKPCVNGQCFRDEGKFIEVDQAMYDKANPKLASNEKKTSEKQEEERQEQEDVLREKPSAPGEGGDDQKDSKGEGDKGTKSDVAGGEQKPDPGSIDLLDGAKAGKSP